MSIVLLPLVITGLNGCRGPVQTQAVTPTARLKVLSESMDADDIAQIRTLIEAGADVNIRNKYGVTPLWRATEGDHNEIAKLLLEAGADVNAGDYASGFTPLWWAAGKGQTEIVRLLLEAGADVNYSDKMFRMTPLMLASAVEALVRIPIVIDAHCAHVEKRLSTLLGPAHT